MCKVCEIFIWAELVAYLKENNLINDKQHGFQQKYPNKPSDIHMENLMLAMDQHIPVNVNYIREAVA